jgi:hypothetical protein
MATGNEPNAPTTTTQENYRLHICPGLLCSQSAAAGALDRQSRDLASLNACCAAAARHIDLLQSEIFADAPAIDGHTASAGGRLESSAAAGEAPAGEAGGGGGPESRLAAGLSGIPLAVRLARAEVGVRELGGRVEGKAKEGAVRELAGRMEELQEQVAANSEGVAALTGATYKRVDEHAAAIQRLAEVIVGSGRAFDKQPCAVCMQQTALAHAGLASYRRPGHQQQQRRPPDQRRGPALAGGRAGGSRGGVEGEGLSCRCGVLHWSK